MSKINDLINEFCPNGVSSRKLSNIANIIRGQRITKNDLVEDGQYFAISGGTKPFSRINKYNRDENTITIAQYGTAGYVDFWHSKIWLTDNAFSVTPTDKLFINCKYIYYFLKNMQNYVYSLSNKSTLNLININEIKNLSIPIPPLEIQEKIVQILDTFTEMETEMEKRIKQYEFYQNRLFNFDGKDVEWLPLWKITIWNKKFQNIDKSKQNKLNKFKSISSKMLKDINLKIGNVKLLSTGNFDGWTNEILAGENLSEGEIITLPEGGLPKIKYWNGKFVNSLNLICTTYDSSMYNTKYIYYFLRNNISLINSFYRGSGIKHPDMSEILEISIPVPPLEIQEKIVQILDKFSSLVNNFNEGIPKEIELRHKQYEYYRNKLLTFKVKNNE